MKTELKLDENLRSSTGLILPFYVKNSTSYIITWRVFPKCIFVKNGFKIPDKKTDEQCIIYNHLYGHIFFDTLGLLLLLCASDSDYSFGIFKLFFWSTKTNLVTIQWLGTNSPHGFTDDGNTSHDPFVKAS